MFDIFVPEQRQWATTVDAASLPVSDAELKAHLMLTDNDDNAVISSVLLAAVDHIEAVTNRKLVSQTVELVVSSFPECSGQVLELPGGVVSEVTSVAYLDAEGVSQTLSASRYELNSRGPHAASIALLDPDDSWPIVRAVGLPVTITYVAGWADADAVPASLKNGIKMVAGSFFDGRHADGQKMEQSIWYQQILSNWRLRGAF